MVNSELIMYYLEKKFRNTPYHFWIKKPQGKVQYFQNGKLKDFVEPLPPLLNNNDSQNYSIFHFNNRIYLSFFYFKDYILIFSCEKTNLLMNEEELEYFNIIYNLSYQQEIIETKEDELNNFIEGIRSVTSSLDLEEVLVKIINNALKVIPSAESGILMLYDAEIERLVPKAVVGFKNNLELFKVKVGESVTGKVFQDGKSRIYHSNNELNADMHKNNISEENLHYILSSTNQLPQSAICVPVAFGKRIIGVMIAHQFKGKKLTDYHLNLLKGFAAQAAIAIQNAQFYSEVKLRLEEVTKLSNELMEKNELLIKRNEIHETLSLLSLQNKGVETIVSELNRMLRKPLFYFDLLENKLYPFAKQNVPFFSPDEIERIFFLKRNPVYVDVSTNRTEHFYLYPIINGNILLGCFVVPYLDSFPQFDRITIEQGSTVLALELVKKRTMTDLYYKKTHEYFSELLQNKEPELLAAKGKEFNLNMDAFLFVTLIEITNYNDLQLLEVSIHQLVSMVKKRLQHYNLLIYGFHNKVTILMSISSYSILSTIINEFQLIKSEWENTKESPLRIGIGTMYEGIGNIGKSYEEANKSLESLKKRNKSGLLFYENIGVNRFFLQQSPFEIEKFLNEVFAPLCIEKGEKSELEKTLLFYIKNGKSTVETAKQLHIHINTLYQRLKKIEKQLNISLDNPEDSLKIQLACHLKETFK